VALVHHELCFGCGRQNLFGLLAELEPLPGGGVSGRCFIKQDHQGPVPGNAHPGLIVAALIDALSFVIGACPPELEVRFERVAPVGVFLALEADTDGARAIADGEILASARTKRA
jgi:hypothetical protein